MLVNLTETPARGANERASRPIIESPAITFTPLAALDDLKPADLPATMKLATGGDQKVKSEHTLVIDGVSGPLPDTTSRALKLTYAFYAGWKFLELKPAADALKRIDGKPKHLGLWVLGDGSGVQLRLRFTDAAGQTFQPAGVRVDFKGWRYLTIPMDGSDATHWGKGDGAVHYPIAWDTLLLVDNTSRAKLPGELSFTGLTLIE
jgi:hypothetical protein